MGTRVAYLSSAFALLFLFVTVFQPVRAHAAPFNEQMIKRLCDRQAKLGSRLPIQLIPPSLCGGGPSEPTLTFTATPSTITEGDSSELEWSTSNASSCTASGGWSGAKNTSGNESVTPSETTTYSLSCTGSGGTVSKSVTVTVNPASPQTGTLIVKKMVIRDDGGTAATTTFSFQIDGGLAVAFEADGQNNVTVNVGTYDVTEVAVSGYTTSYENCSDVAVAQGETEACTITNNDIAQEVTTLTLVKAVINNNGGTSTPSQWTLSADGPTDISGTSGSAEVTNAVVSPGTYLLTESDGPAGYSVSPYSCVINDGPSVSEDSVTLVAGDNAICTVVNNDIAPELTLVKTVINDDEGTASTTDFQAKIDDVNVPWQVPQLVDAGTHTASEVLAAGYTAGAWGGDCAADGSITIHLGQKKTCTITNDDTDVQQPTPTLSLNANPTSVTPGAGSATSTLTWSSSNVTFCQASDGWTGTRAVSGSEIVSPGATTTYQLDCGGANGTTTQSVTVNFVPAPVQTSGIVINEIAWMGSVVDGSTTTATSTNAEWIELRNTGGSSVDLTNWSLIATDGTPEIFISNECSNVTVSAGGFYLMTRTNPSVYGVAADCIYSGALENTSEILTLFDAASTTIDMIDGGTNWGIGGAPTKGNNATKDTAQRADDDTWHTAVPTPRAANN